MSFFLNYKKPHDIIIIEHYSYKKITDDIRIVKFFIGLTHNIRWKGRGKSWKKTISKISINM